MIGRITLALFCLLPFAFSYLCLFGRDRLRKVKGVLLHDQRAAVVLFGAATVVLLHKVLHLSVADFGNYKYLLFVAFALICGLSFFKVRDLLALRGLAILLLFLCDQVLDEVYCTTFFLHGAFVCVVYVAVIFSMAVGAAPYLLRDTIDRLLLGGKASKFVGYSCLAFAAIALRAVFI
jgi:hypothetical protein